MIEAFTEEIWKDVPEYEGLYQVSNLGRVKRLSGKNCVNNRLIKGNIDKYGYRYLALYKNNKPKTFKLHRLIATVFIPNIENKPCIDHINNVRTDNRVENLRWCTIKENNNNPRSNVNHAKKRVINLNTGEVFDSATKASLQMGLNRLAVATSIVHNTKCGGFKWKYVI